MGERGRHGRYPWSSVMDSHDEVDVFHCLHSRRRRKRKRIASPLNLGPLLLAVLCNVFFIESSLSLDTDGMVLLSFKYLIVEDPLGVLSNWNDGDQTPCSWRGVACGTPDNFTTYYRVVGLSLPNSRLSGSIPSNMGAILFLRTLDLSNNSLSGSLPPTLLAAAAELRSLDLSNNRFTGQIPETVGQLTNLQLLNLSANGLSGGIPENLTALQNLTVVSLRGNYLTGGVPSGLTVVQILDLSSNSISGQLPPDVRGDNLNYMNLSYNNLSGEIPADFASRMPGNATLDLSYNNLTGEIPKSVIFLNQDPRSFSGNPGLCGVPTRNPCPIPSFPSSLPNVYAPTTSPPAFAAIPKTVASSPGGGDQANSESRGGHSGLRPRAIVGIVVGDVVVIGILAVVFTYVYRWRKRRSNLEAAAEKMESKSTAAPAIKDSCSSSCTSSESRGIVRWSCLRKAGNEEESSDTTASDVSDDVDNGSSGIDINNHHPGSSNEPYKQGTLVTVDVGEGGGELELDTLLKASAYILGATGSRIMYKAVLEDGTALAVRRIGESGLERLKDFEGQVRAIAKLVHPNLVRVRGFYWGIEEKLIIYDFVPNGSLANARYRKVSSSPGHLPWEARLKIARGVARGLTYLHEKKHVHGNLKPSNILLGPDMEPKIGDFGLERLVVGDTSYKAGGSARIFGSKRSTASKDSFQDVTASLGPSPSPSPSPSSISGISPYHAPESLRTLKPSPKWDVYSFGVILLELLSGKIVVVDELGQANGVVVDDHNRAIRMADVAIRADLEGKEEALLTLLKLGFSCASPIPQKRPPIKEALLVLEKIQSNSSSSSSLSSYYYGHL
ncbi:hypothetical protein SAY87_023971 [Trapa incisa]|uniref:Protein kinase domain-containing protein n=1 Tax=Trapa incisa TaxID=236973 RepID=A0AAN7KZS1_9MYRT|nr:hypothetical protein SAY87_023971 [Trapa incisa]